MDNGPPGCHGSLACCHQRVRPSCGGGRGSGPCSNCEARDSGYPFQAEKRLGLELPLRGGGETNTKRFQNRTGGSHQDLPPGPDCTVSVEFERRALLGVCLKISILHNSNSQLKSNKNPEGKRFVIEGEGANTIFIVDEKGNLYVTKALDREEKSLYRLTAWMYDGNGNLIEDSGDFVVQVTDINDKSPVFTRTYNGSIMERSMIGEILKDLFQHKHTGNEDNERRITLQYLHLKTCI